MPAIRYDFVVFGATGFTGARVVELLAEGNHKRTWAVAGRNRGKLEAVLRAAQVLTPKFDPSKIEIIICDTADYASLVAMARRAHVVLNLVGPYRFHGIPAVRACIEAGTHSVDVSGEPMYLEQAERDLDAAARDAGVSVITSAGFDSIPADIGFAFTQSQFGTDGVRGVACAHAESFLSVVAPRGFVGHATTLECAVHGFANVADLVALRRSVAAPRPPKCNPPLPRRGAVSRLASGRFALPFPGADASVVRRSQRRIDAADPSHAQSAYGAYFTVGSTFWLLVVIMLGAVLKVLTRFSWGRRVIIAYPGLFSMGMFSHAGPTMEQIATARFEMRFVARGTDGSVLQTRVEGPEAGYRATPLFMVAMADTIIEDGDRVPRGVLTPAFASHRVMPQVLARFKRAGITFERLEDQDM
jgi:short subunit dehydrogenase-like uncharacterized protein